MSTATISGYERNIVTIFSDEFAFEIPRYQRPYAWTTENVEELLFDIDAYLDDYADISEISPYFLGSIVLIKNTAPEAQVIDGQQRLTTLTIILSLLRHLSSDADVRAELTKYIYESAGRLGGTSKRPRLRLRERDREFFEKYIQKDADGIAELEKLNPRSFDIDSQQNIYQNALHLKSLLQQMSDERQEKFAKFILQRCFLVVVTAPNQSTAYRIFSVLNQRGLELSSADILKAEITGKINDKELQNNYTDKWEDIEATLGRKPFDDLFSHIRMIHRKVKAKGTTLNEIQEHIKPQDKPTQFIDDVLTPLSNAYYDIFNEQFADKEFSTSITSLFRFLKQIDNFDWYPPAILYLSKHENNPRALFKFFTDLERLAACMMIMRTNVNDRIKRYGSLLTAIEDNSDLFTEESLLQLRPDERRHTLNNLEGDIYGEQYARYVLLRLDSLLTTGEARYTYPIISIEHVLPQNPAIGSAWLKLFSNEEQRVKYTNRLGNLVLLSRKKNSEARNYEFERKKTTYFKTEAAPFALTAQVRDESQWTPKILEQRQHRLLKVLQDTWRLA